MGNYYRTPAELFESKNHTKGKTYSCIESLCRNKDCYCWASNNFLAKKIGLKNPGNISQCIQKLKKEGWIRIEINKNRRKIWLLRDYSGKIIGNVRNNKSQSSEIPKESIKNSNINSNRKYNQMKKEFMDNSRFP